MTDELRCTGVLEDRDRILFRGARVACYGNVICNHNRAEAVVIVNANLGEIGVH